MQRRIFSLLFPIAGVLLFQSVQAQLIESPPGNFIATTGGNPYNTGINADGTGTPTLPITLTLEPGSSSSQAVTPSMLLTPRIVQLRPAHLSR